MTLKEGRRAVGVNPGCFCHYFFQFEGLFKKKFFLIKFLTVTFHLVIILAIFPMLYSKSLSLSSHPPAVPPLPPPLCCPSFLPTANHQFVLPVSLLLLCGIYQLVVFFRFHI